MVSGAMQNGSLSQQIDRKIVQVFNAPHIAKLSAVVGAKFTPIRYKLQGKSIVSNVGFSSSLFREGWLSASGTIEASGTNTLHLVFDKYWIDFGLNNLRHELQGKLRIKIV